MADGTLLHPEQAIPLLRSQLEENVEALRHEDPDVYAWELLTLNIVKRAFGERSTHAGQFGTKVTHARQTDQEAQAEHVENINYKKGLLRAFLKELEIVPLHPLQTKDSRFAQMAVDEARKSATEDERVHPMVGCVVVKDGKVLATAHRGEIKGCHAEFIALEKKLGESILTGCTVYTTLEPCTDRSPTKVPCADRLIERRVARVVIGTLDPNPDIRGKGWWKIQAANITVEMFPHALAMELRELNRDFFRLFSEGKSTISRPRAFIQAEARNGSARFRAADQSLGMFWNIMPFAEGPDYEVFLAEGPAMWLRLIPPEDTSKEWGHDELLKCGRGPGVTLQPLIWNNLQYLRAEDGIGAYSTSNNLSQEMETGSVAFAFNTGEIWCVDTTVLQMSGKKNLHFLDIARTLVQRLRGYGEFLQCLGIQPPFNWIAGLEGIKGWRLNCPPPNNHVSTSSGETCLSNVIVASGRYDPKDSAPVSLRPLFEQLFKKCGLKVPEHIDEAIRTSRRF